MIICLLHEIRDFQFIKESFKKPVKEVIGYFDIWMTKAILGQVFLGLFRSP